MYPANVDYYRAGSVAEAIRLLGQHQDSKLIAGGHSLVPLMKLRLATPSTLIDIGRLSELSGVSVNNGTVSIGALTTHTQLASSADLGRECPMIPEAAGMIGDRIVRNHGTIGGNIVHSDPASDLPTVLTALGARIKATGPGGDRIVDVSDFFLGLLTTALSENEVLTSIEVPAIRSNQGMAYVKFPHPASRYAVVGAAASVTVQGGRCTAVSVAVGGVEPNPTRAASVESALVGKEASESAIAVAAKAVAHDLGTDLMSDVFASGEYRKAMAEVYVNRVLTAAVARAG